MKRGYNWFAPYYERISKWVFGDAIQKASDYFLKDTPNDSKVLIIGGGTGKILNTLSEQGHKGQVLFLDLEQKMIEMAKMRPVELNIKFIHSDIFDYEMDEVEIIHMAFFLDQFKLDEIQKILEEVAKKNRKSRLIVVDFESPIGWRQKLLLWTMYRFFGIGMGINARELNDWFSCCISQGWTAVDSYRDKKNFISAYLMENLDD